MKDLFNNPIAAKPAPNAKKIYSKKPVEPTINAHSDSALAQVRPYRIARLSTTQVWCINL